MSELLLRIANSKITLIGVLMAALSPFAVLLARGYWDLVERFLLAAGFSEIAAEGWGYVCMMVTLLVVFAFLLFKAIDKWMP